MLKSALYSGQSNDRWRIAGLAFVCLALLSLSLAACGDGGSSGASGGTGATQADDSSSAKLDPEVSATLNVWSSNNFGDYPKTDESAVERFNEKFPNVKVKVTYLPIESYFAKWKAALASGGPPDVMQIPPDGSAVPVVQSGQLASMGPILAEGFPEFTEAALEGVTLEGDEWGVPIDVNSLQIAYNKEIFAENGLTPPKTTDELLEIAAKLNEKGILPIAAGGKEKWVPGDLWAAQLAYTDPSGKAMREAESGEGSWSNPVFLAAAEELEGLVEGDVFAPGSSSMGAYIEALNLFVGGESAMFYPVGNFISGAVEEKVEDRFEWGLFPFPSPDGTPPRATGAVARAFGLPSAGSQQELGAEFLRMYTNQEGGEAMMKYNFIPSWDVDIPSDTSPLFKNLLQAQKTIAPRYFVYNNPAVVPALQDAVSALLEGNADPEDVVDAIAGAGE